MPKQTAYTLSPKAASQLPEIARRVLGRGNDNDGTPYTDDGLDRWFEISTYEDFPVADDSFYRWIYICAVYAGPLSKVAIPGGSIKALNTWERQNTTTYASGYSIADDSEGNAACGSVIAVEPIPSAGQRYPLGRRCKVQDDDGNYDYYFAFTERNDPTVKTSPPG